MKKLAAALLIVFIISTSSTPALADSSDRAFDATVDIILVRPISLAATVVGTAVFIVSLPFSIPSKSVGATAKALVADPFNFTFTRPVGVFNEMETGRTQSTEVPAPAVEKAPASENTPKE